MSDVRFPTSLEADGSDAIHPDPDYSAWYLYRHNLHFHQHLQFIVHHKSTEWLLALAERESGCGNWEVVYLRVFFRGVVSCLAFNPASQYCQDLTSCSILSYVTLSTNSGWKGFGLAFTLGRGNEIICHCIDSLRFLVVGVRWVAGWWCWCIIMIIIRLRWDKSDRGI